MSSPHEQAEFDRMVRGEFDYLMKKMDRRGRDEKNNPAQDAPKELQRNPGVRVDSRR